MAYYRNNKAVIEGGETEEELEEFFDYLFNVVNKQNIKNFEKAAPARQKIIDAVLAEIELDYDDPTIN